jgi:hypothetical protein
MHINIALIFETIQGSKTRYSENQGIIEKFIE